MRNYGVFDIVGPVMIGPSSSHTAGAARLGQMARLLAGGKVESVEFQLHGSFAKTYRGHGTDKALLAGILGLSPDDERLHDAFALADEAGIAYRFTPVDLGEVHPNTVRFLLTVPGGHPLTMTGSSLGGGKVVVFSIDGLEVHFTGETPILITEHNDVPGVVSLLAALLYQRDINIGNMRVNRTRPGREAYMYVELDGALPSEVLEQIRRIPGVKSATWLNALG